MFESKNTMIMDSGVAKWNVLINGTDIKSGDNFIVDTVNIDSSDLCIFEEAEESCPVRYHNTLTAVLPNRKADVSFLRVSRENHPCPQQTLCHGFRKLHLR